MTLDIPRHIKHTKSDEVFELKITPINFIEHS